MNGHIKFFKPGRYGMIEPDDKKGDVFFHAEHLDEGAHPREGMPVEFSLNPDYPKRRVLKMHLLVKSAYVPIDSRSQRKAVAAHGD